jgi:hypothetical protein
MKFYIASRTKAAPITRKLAQQLTQAGHSCSFDWVKEMIILDYENNRVKANELSQTIRQRITEADVFILLWDEALYGALIELGIFLGSSSKASPKKIYIVGKKDRVCMFEMMPEFTIVATTAQLVTDIIGQ